MEQFTEFAQEFGLPWAIALALGVALWRQVQYERKSTVPRDMYDREESRHHDDVIPTLKATTGTLEELVNAFSRLELMLQERLSRRDDHRAGE
jgi:hypothetical protein